MSLKRYFNYFHSNIIMLVISFLLLMPFAVSSIESRYELTKVAELEHRLIPQPNWQQLIVNPSNKRQYFIIRESGQIYLIDDNNIEPQAILDMSVDQQIGSSLFKLTAVTLHPNFSLRNQDGYGTFYTAHIENINQETKTKRIQEQDDDLSINFDAVITEWQFNAVNHQRVNLNSKREVLRIGVPDNTMVIKQMSFSPYIKSWNEDFGLLYIALEGRKEWTQPLYSGVILRINPAKFGLRSFTIPNNNLYMKNSEINDAIYLLGGQKIAKFIWAGKNSEHILVSHQYNNQYVISLTNGQNDWRASKGKQILYQSDNAIQDMLMYHGHELPLLRSKLLLLRQKDQKWFVDSLVLNTTGNKNTRNESKIQLEWPITSQILPVNSQIMLSSDNNDEIFLLEKTINILFRLTQQALSNEHVVAPPHEANNSEKSSTDNRVFILFLMLLLLSVAYYWFKRNGNSVKKIVRTQFTSFELSESDQQIGLYYRHENKADTTIDIVDIVSSEIKLNGQSINVINDQVDYGFNHIKEQDLRTIFVKEKIDKMVDDKIRQISLLLTDIQNKNYTICLYMRKGSNRITKKSYVKIVDELIDWCWFLAEKINAQNTDERTIKREVLSKPKAETAHNTTNKNQFPLHHQAAAIRPTPHKIDNTNQALVINKNSPALNVIKENKHAVELAESESNKASQNNTIDTELVYALEKLVNLQQQGFLTMDEFSKAKEKLLKTLLEK